MVSKLPITCQIISFRLSDSLLKLVIVTIEETSFLVVLNQLHFSASEADGVNAKQIISCYVATKLNWTDPTVLRLCVKMS